MMFKKLCFAILISQSLIAFDKYSVEQDSIRLDSSKPHAYLSLEKSNGDQVTLKFHNNSRWAINLCSRAYYPWPFLARKIVNGRERFFLKNEQNYKLCYGIRSYFSRVFTASKVPRANRTNKSNTQKSDCETEQTYAYFDDNHSYRQWIAPGEAISFNIPAENLKAGQVVYIEYNYDWEEPEYELRGPKHRAEFYDFQIGIR
jgi:hypothetical protein